MSENGSSGLAAALVAAATEMPHVEADGVNPHFKSKFVTLDNLIARTRPTLTKHGLAIIQEPSTLEHGEPALRTTLLHVSGESRSSTMPLRLAKDDMQGLGAAITYARRYAWAALLGISEQEDDDGNAASAPAPDPLATKPQQNNIHRLITLLAKGGAVTEAQIREGMQKEYGTQITAMLTREQAGDLITRLKAAAGEDES